MAGRFDSLVGEEIVDALPRDLRMLRFLDAQEIAGHVREKLLVGEQLLLGEKAAKLDGVPRVLARDVTARPAAPRRSRAAGQASGLATLRQQRHARAARTPPWPLVDKKIWSSNLLGIGLESM